MNLQTLDWNKFRIFYHVVKAGSLTKAAQNLHTFQPSLSRSIMTLEESLKIRLLERTSRGVIPTEEGKALLETVDVMVGAFSRYEKKLHANKEEPQGLLKVSISKVLPRLKIASELPKFLKTYPHMRVSFLEIDEDIDFQPYEADAAIREFEEDAQNLEQIYLTTSSIEMYASPDYLHNKEVPQKIEDLEAHHLIALALPNNLPSCAVNSPLSIGLSQGKKRTPSLCVSSITQMTWAVREGLGIAALPEEYVRGDPSFVKVLPHLPPSLVDLYYVYPRYHQETKRVTAYGEFLSEQFKALERAEIH